MGYQNTTLIFDVERRKEYVPASRIVSHSPGAQTGVNNINCHIVSYPHC
jgi:hypothetical protein